jgi:hypothetical protein
MFLKTFFLYIAALIAFALYSLFAHWGRPFELGDSPFAILLLISQPILWCLTVKVPPKPSLDTEPKQGAYFRLALQPWFQPMQDFVMGQFLLTTGLLFYAFFEIHMGRSATPGAAMFLAAGLLMLVFSYLRLHKKLVRMLITASVIFPIVFLELAR